MPRPTFSYILTRGFEKAGLGPISGLYKPCLSAWLSGPGPARLHFCKGEFEGVERGGEKKSDECVLCVHCADPRLRPVRPFVDSTPRCPPFFSRRSESRLHSVSLLPVVLFRHFAQSSFFSSHPNQLRSVNRHHVMCLFCALQGTFHIFATPANFAWHIAGYTTWYLFLPCLRYVSCPAG